MLIAQISDPHVLAPGKLFHAPEKAAPLAPAPAKRYANMPDEAVPYRNFTKPYKEWYLDTDTLGTMGLQRGASY